MLGGTGLSDNKLGTRIRYDNQSSPQSEGKKMGKLSRAQYGFHPKNALTTLPVLRNVDDGDVIVP